MRFKGVCGKGGCQMAWKTIEQSSALFIICKLQMGRTLPWHSFGATTKNTIDLRHIAHGRNPAPARDGLNYDKKHGCKSYRNWWTVRTYQPGQIEGAINSMKLTGSIFVVAVPTHLIVPRCSRHVRNWKCGAGWRSKKLQHHADVETVLSFKLGRM